MTQRKRQKTRVLSHQPIRERGSESPTNQRAGFWVTNQSESRVLSRQPIRELTRCMGWLLLPHCRQFVHACMPFIINYQIQTSLSCCLVQYWFRSEALGIKNSTHLNDGFKVTSKSYHIDDQGCSSISVHVPSLKQWLYADRCIHWMRHTPVLYSLSICVVLCRSDILNACFS